MTKLYTMQRYLQCNTLQRKGLAHFDCWASTFGETVTAIELAPEGTGYRARTRFSKFFNLPKGKSISACLADRTDYAKNPDITNDGELLSSYECDP